MSLRTVTKPDPEAIPITRVRSESYGLTKREITIAKLLANGHSRKTVAALLKLHIATVQNDMKMLRARTNAATTQQALVILAKAGLV